MTNSDSQQVLLDLIQGGRWAALATCNSAGPIASQVAYVVEPEPDRVLMLLSRLAAHTRALLDDPRCALSISETDDGREDPQTLRRVTLRGRITVINRDDPDYDASARHYLDRLPASRQLFDFSDFLLLRLAVEQVRYVGGFADAHSFSGAQLKAMGRRS